MTDKKNEELNEDELDQVTGGHANLEVSHIKPSLTGGAGIRATNKAGIRVAKGAGIRVGGKAGIRATKGFAQSGGDPKI
ncbi:MAG: Blp family class II bacteriocin [Parasphingorhabdus sp.]